MKKVLITGATGFLGNHIAELFWARGFAVHVLLRPSSKEERLATLKYTVFRGSLNKMEDIEPAIKTCDYVVHCASNTSQNSTDFEIYRKANIDSTKYLIAASKKHYVKKFILVGSANSFTNGPKENPGTETSGFMDFLTGSGYARSKFLAQVLLLEEVRKNAFPGMVVAPTFMMGPRDFNPSSGALLLYALKNKCLFYPHGGKSFVSVKSVATAVVNAVEMGKIGEVYLLSGLNLSYKEYFQKIAAVAGQSKFLIPLPKFVLTMVKLGAFFLPSKKMQLIRTNAAMLFSDNYFSNAKAKKSLKMPETKIDAVIEESIVWFKENNYF